ncbi:MAG: hypothetical protein A3C44_06930 [Gammaproteobacteria bacterium RIFCSPHIGHO2_02_FULL_39_13]|nr:MAG: hypothetical protein A3C44_06930 [Gammaproteobacteria bacterium RIFCSPHIGHO2_02_FULL_39_13]OGT48166.1 MAG: hypothetical protein A3E53_03145 [Gammaproteobacteria bacterium RIFCSPHIGHO2_12_FULL_39_24]
MKTKLIFTVIACAGITLTAFASMDSLCDTLRKECAAKKISPKVCEIKMASCRYQLKKKNDQTQKISPNQ